MQLNGKPNHLYPDKKQPFPSDIPNPNQYHILPASRHCAG